MGQDWVSLWFDNPIASVKLMRRARKQVEELHLTVKDWIYLFEAGIRAELEV